MVDATDSEKKRSITVVRIDSSNTSRTSDAIGGILCEVVAGILHRTIELRLKPWFGGQLTCGDWAKQLCTARADVAQHFNLLHLELEASQPSLQSRSELEVQLTHKYIAGVVYRNDSDVATALAEPLARTKVAPWANKIDESVASRCIVYVWCADSGWEETRRPQMLLKTDVGGHAISYSKPHPSSSQVKFAHVWDKMCQ
jgi:hypothetical protein